METYWVDGAVKLGLPSFLCLVLVGYLIKTQGDSFKRVSDALTQLAIAVTASATQRMEQETKMNMQLAEQTVWLQVLAQNSGQYSELEKRMLERLRIRQGADVLTVNPQVSTMAAEAAQEGTQTP